MTVLSSDFLRLIRAAALHRNLRPAEGLPLPDGPAGKETVKLAVRHKVLEALHTWSSVSPGALDEAALGLLRPLVLSRKLIARQITREWGRIASGFREAGIPLVCLKGPALSLELYGAPDRRESRDLDFLVDSRRMAPVHSVMESLGYVPEHYYPLPVSPSLEKSYLGLNHHVGYAHPGVPVPVEIHYRTWKNSLEGFPVDPAQVIGTARRLETEGGPVLVPAAGKHLAYMVFHGSSHGWCLLHWVADLAALWTHMSPGTEEDFLGEIHSLGMERQLKEGLKVAGFLFDLPPREGWPLPVPASSDFSRLCLAYLTGTKKYRLSSALTLKKAATRSFRQKSEKSFTAALWFMPRPSSLELLPLPPAWQFLHFLLGPFFLSGRGLRKLLARLGWARNP